MAVTFSDQLLITATVAGPILAVQAQKFVERARDVSNRREWVFFTLMATRGARLDAEHVRALNSIDLAFYGHRLLGRPYRTKKCQKVLDRWHEYLDWLSNDFDLIPEAQRPTFFDRGMEIFLNLLEAIATERGVEFDRVTLRRGGYHPISMSTAFSEATAVRAAALAVLSGQSPIRVDINQPTEPTAAA